MNWKLGFLVPEQLISQPVEAAFRSSIAYCHRHYYYDSHCGLANSMTFR